MSTEWMDGDTIGMVEYPKGEWVKYEDALKWSDESFREGRLSAQEEPPETALTITYINMPECTCGQNADMIMMSGTETLSFWICPAHGYKKR